jgi:hypothetical protein
MKKFVFDYVCKMEGWKTAIKSLHWNADNLSQHRLCDDIAGEIADFQDTVSEVEQSLDGNLEFNKLTGTKYTISNLTAFVKDVIKDTLAFYKQLGKSGDDYVGLRSECETFLAGMQKNVYLVKFTLKEDFKRNYARKKAMNENKIQISNGKIDYVLSESELKTAVNEAVTNVLNRYNYLNG